MSRRVRQLIAPVATAAALAVPAYAVASPQAVIRDCVADGSLDGGYSDADKRAALQQLPADQEEYSDCPSVIAAAIGGGSTSQSSGSGDGADGTATPAEKPKARGAARKRQAKKQARERRATEVALGDRIVDPRTAGVLESADTENGLPLPVVLALIALGLMGAAGALMLLSRRSPRVADALRRVSLPRIRR